MFGANSFTSAQHGIALHRRRHTFKLCYGADSLRASSSAPASWPRGSASAQGAISGTFLRAFFILDDAVDSCHPSVNDCRIWP